MSISYAIEDDDGDLIGVMETQDLCDATPILHALFRTAFQGRQIGGQLFRSAHRPGGPQAADPGQHLSQRRPGGRITSVVLADGWRILGLQDLRRRRGVLNAINKIC